MNQVSELQLLQQRVAALEQSLPKDAFWCLFESSISKNYPIKDRGTGDSLVLECGIWYHLPNRWRGAVASAQNAHKDEFAAYRVIIL